jgi:CRISPR/Cas system CMR subunit Cmr6 (Cas7 group RAMP superfamily)
MQNEILNKYTFICKNKSITNEKNQLIKFQTPIVESLFGIEENFGKFIIKIALNETNYEQSEFLYWYKSLEESVKNSFNDEKEWISNLVEKNKISYLQLKINKKYDKFLCNIKSKKQIVTYFDIKNGTKLIITANANHIWEFENKRGISLIITTLNVL